MGLLRTVHMALESLEPQELRMMAFANTYTAYLPTCLPVIVEPETH